MTNARYARYTNCNPYYDVNYDIRSFIYTMIGKESSPRSITLNSDDALCLNMMQVIFDNKRPVIYRDPKGNLYACTDTTGQDRVHINNDMLRCIPRNKMIDIREALKKRKEF